MSGLVHSAGLAKSLISLNSKSAFIYISIATLGELKSVPIKFQ